MIYEFRFATEDSPVLDREVLCFLVDDGAYDIPATLLAPFTNASLREIRAMRQRITLLNDEGTVVHITSNIELPVTHNVTP